MRAATTTWTQVLAARLADYAQLIKFRLSVVVVFSALMGFAVAGVGSFSWADAGVLALGGMLITGAANAMNEYIERESDGLMARTASRPLPAGRMSGLEAVLSAGVMGVVGLALIAYYFNELGALVGAVALLSYALVYTPLKKSGPIAVFVGAIPGALPPVIGWVCFTGYLGIEALVLFSIQFLWQFIHFWAIAWLVDSDYEKAGFRLLPSAGGKDKLTAGSVLALALLLAAAGLIPWLVGMSPMWVGLSLVALGSVVSLFAFQLVVQLSDKAARKLLMITFMYLPLALFLIVVG